MNPSQKSLQISCSEFGMISKPVVVGGRERECINVKITKPLSELLSWPVPIISIINIEISKNKFKNLIRTSKFKFSFQELAKYYAQASF
jgi:hypothetical protein